jgi:hypothetical protein|tara:strand:+ start:425 stop:769 length:345 start_codon:yes stop_codon:yes gene_type:complete
MNLKPILILFSGLSFILFGLACFSTSYFHEEFKRYGLTKYRVITGGLQLLGGLGSLAGLFINELIVVSSAGLSLLMMLAVIVRLRINDSLTKTSPAFLYMTINIYLFWLSIIVY